RRFQSWACHQKSSADYSEQQRKTFRALSMKIRRPELVGHSRQLWRTKKPQDLRMQVPAVRVQQRGDRAGEYQPDELCGLLAAAFQCSTDSVNSQHHKPDE